MGKLLRGAEAAPLPRSWRRGAASTQEEHEGIREVPKPSRAVRRRRRSTEAIPGRSGISELVWGSHGWLVSAERGRCEILSGPWSAGRGLGVVVCPSPLGRCLCCVPAQTELVFCVSVCLCTFSRSLCSLVAEPWLLHISV